MTMHPTDLVLQADNLETIAELSDLINGVAHTGRIKPKAGVMRLTGADACSREAVLSSARRLKIDAAFVPSNLKLSDFRAIFFDMDSTLCSTETLDEMAELLGVGEACARITHDAMTGKIPDYAASLRARVKLLEGMSAGCIDTVWQSMQTSRGIPELLSAAKAAGLKTFIVSSGFTVLTERMKNKLGMTATCANRIEVLNGRFTGRVFGPNDETILDAAGKAAFVERTMRAMGLTPKEAICCGDGSNDIRMISAAGLGVGFRPKAVLRPHCAVTLDFVGFEGLLNILRI